MGIGVASLELPTRCEASGGGKERERPEADGDEGGGFNILRGEGKKGTPSSSRPRFDEEQSAAAERKWLGQRGLAATLQMAYFSLAANQPATRDIARMASSEIPLKREKRKYYSSDSLTSPQRCRKSPPGDSPDGTPRRRKKTCAWRARVQWASAGFSGLRASHIAVGKAANTIHVDAEQELPYLNKRRL